MKTDSFKNLIGKALNVQEVFHILWMYLILLFLLFHSRERYHWKNTMSFIFFALGMGARTENFSHFWWKNIQQFRGLSKSGMACWFMLSILGKYIHCKHQRFSTTCTLVSCDMYRDAWDWAKQGIHKMKYL